MKHPRPRFAFPLLAVFCVIPWTAPVASGSPARPEHASESTVRPTLVFGSPARPGHASRTPRRPADALVARGDTLRLTLSAALQRVLSTSPEIRAQEAVVRVAEARYDLARASRYLTTFSATSAHAVAPGLTNPNGTATDRLWTDPDVRNDWDDLRPFNRIDVSAIQPIYTFGEVSGNIQAARSAIGLEEQGVRTRRIEAAVRTAELYYGLVLAKALNRLTGEAGDIVSRAMREIDRLLEEGAEDVDDADRYQVLITQQEFLRRVVAPPSFDTAP